MIGIKLIKNGGLISFVYVLLNLAGFATDSEVTPPSVTPFKILHYDTGYIMSFNLTKGTSYTNSTEYSFKTNTICPPSFNAFFQVIPTMAYSGSMEAITSFGVCISSYSTDNGSSPSYTLNLLVTKQNINFDTGGIYGVEVNPDNPSGFYWNVYCYPQGMPVPTNFVLSGGNGMCSPSSDPTGTGTIPF